MTDLFSGSYGTTPIDAETAAGLVPDWIATQADLNAAEQENILSARTWAFNRRRRWTTANLLTVQNLQGLHRRMLVDVWRWAGTLRQRDTNIGIDPWRIPMAMHDLCGDVLAQTADTGQLVWPADEIAVRFHYRLVSIHPFPNGNGRHARFCADLLAVVLARPTFSWASNDLTAASDIRQRYIAALQHVDRTGEFGMLIDFARG